MSYIAILIKKGHTLLSPRDENAITFETCQQPLSHIPDAGLVDLFYPGHFNRIFKRGNENTNHLVIAGGAYFGVHNYGYIGFFCACDKTLKKRPGDDPLVI